MDMFEKYSKGLNHHHVAKNLNNGRMIDIKTEILYNSTKLDPKYENYRKMFIFTQKNRGFISLKIVQYFYFLYLN